MPLCKLHASVELPKSLLAEVSTAIAETIGKPEKYVMVVADEARVLMSGEAGDAVYAEIKSIGGLNRVVNHEITMKITVLMNDHLGIPADRIYTTFAEVSAEQWGWNGSLFG